MIPADVENSGPFTVRDDATGRTLTYHELSTAQDMARRLCDRFERSMTVFDIQGRIVGTAESFGGGR